MLDREGYFFSISGGWRKTLKRRGPYRNVLLNMYVRARTDQSDWRPEDLVYIRPKRVYIWERIDWVWLRKYLIFSIKEFKIFCQESWAKRGQPIKK
ncbi:hypothetical protein WEN_02220 [Mycoplasma wenyonii str. Massachusetts]|uniref:Uncharacterized protein n=1 Tax=Mycoplasma wenyonii (strain Massachusetts) TaxID=1197325 RepID=I6YB82_MYCWM|nr:hypothetical protein [Mycoplasma wenyonii]AFN65231.1 hypothetical protein WEN_02220 [Mycoplasma wenyonii str. Massachusetts]